MKNLIALALISSMISCMNLNQGSQDVNTNTTINNNLTLDSGVEYLTDRMVLHTADTTFNVCGRSPVDTSKLFCYTIHPFIFSDQGSYAVVNHSDIVYELPEPFDVGLASYSISHFADSNLITKPEVNCWDLVLTVTGLNKSKLIGEDSLSIVDFNIDTASLDCSSLRSGDILVFYNDSTVLKDTTLARKHYKHTAIVLHSDSSKTLIIHKLGKFPVGISDFVQFQRDFMYGGVNVIQSDGTYFIGLDRKMREESEYIGTGMNYFKE